MADRINTEWIKQQLPVRGEDRWSLFQLSVFHRHHSEPPNLVNKTTTAIVVVFIVILVLGNQSVLVTKVLTRRAGEPQGKRH